MCLIFCLHRFRDPMAYQVIPAHDGLPDINLLVTSDPGPQDLDRTRRGSRGRLQFHSFLASLSLKSHPIVWGNSRFLKRRMVEKNGESTARMGVVVSVSFLLLGLNVAGVLAFTHGCSKHLPGPSLLFFPKGDPWWLEGTFFCS